MKSNNRSLDKLLLEGGEQVKSSVKGAIGSLGKLVALGAALITVLVTFTDIRFGELSFRDALPQLLLLIISSYVIYFSLEDAGERLGEGCEEFLAAKERYDALCEKITGEDVGALREFLERYCKEELGYRRRAMLLSLGLSEEDFLRYQRGEIKGGAIAKKLRKVARLKSAGLTAKVLLYDGGIRERSELENPEAHRFWGQIIRLLPSTLCMAVTVSVILSVRSDMQPSDILTAIIKLSTLPAFGFRGYSAGYFFAKCDRVGWYKIRSDVMEAFLSGKISRNFQEKS